MSNWETKNLTGNEDSTNFDTTVNQDTIASTDSLPSNSGHSILGDDAPKWKSGDVILNEFEVIRHLGKGGAGSVYLVKRISIGDLFAAKVPVRSIADSVRLRKLFYREIRTWLGLPVHPHLSACRFIRTIGPKIIVFSEFVDGGSLNEWIVKHKLLNLSDILDVAIQIAWGLHAAHTNKVIHQDIKPSNILVSNDGHVKITDFGLSRAYQAINDEDDTILALRKESIPLTLDQASVSTGIMTPMYCSPEQSDRLPLDYRTDIWSYGLTVLSMFTGPTRWISGVLAESILDGVLKQGPYNPFPTLTNDLVDMLRRCFKKNPQDRWASMKDIADFLITKYMEHTGKDYFRQEPAITVQKGFKSNSPTHPAILKAYEVLGKDLGELEIMEANSVKSRKTWVLHQIELIHELALELRNIETGDKRIQRNLIFDLLIHKIILHREIADFEGAFEILNQLLSFLGHEPFENRSQDDQNQTGRVNYQFGYTHLMRSEFKQAVSYFTRAEEIWIPLAEKYDVDGYWDNAINAMNSCAVALHSMKEIQRPLELQNRCIEIFDKLINQKGRKDLRGKAAGNMTNKALLLSEIGKTEEAIELHKKGIAIREMICFDEGQDDLLPSLPTGYINLACDLYALERYQEAIEYNNKAIDLMEDLVFNKGMDDLRLFLARTYMNRGNAESGKNLTDAALSSFDCGIKLIKQMLYNEGNTSLVGELLFVHRNKAHALVDKQHYEEAQTLLKSSLELVIEYYKPSDINKYMVYVTWIFNDLSGIYRKAGNEDKALDCLLQAVVLFKEHSTDAIISAHYIPHLRKTLWNYLNHLSESSGFKEISQEAKHFNDLLSQYEVSVDDADVNELKLGIQFYEILAASKLKKDHVTKQTLAHLLETMTEIMKGKPGNALAPLVSKAEDILNTW